MQFEVSKNTLLKAISNVNGAVEKKNTIPVLQNIRIDVNNQIADPVVSLSATDMDVLITSKFKADIVRSGSTTVSAQMFFDIVRKVPENTEIVIMQDSPNILQIRYGKSKFNLPCIDPSEFPDISEGDLGEQILISGSSLARMIDKTRFAISNDETRYHLNGIYFATIQ
jgi:DNA polymerase-3 subunit beta